MMSFEIKRIADLSAYLPKVFETEFGFESFRAVDSMSTLNCLLADFVSDLWVGIESSYVDKLYRDSYYNYYSSKLTPYKRDCIRLSFFSSEIFINDFQDELGVKKLQDAYKGFVVIRPTPPAIIGRNVLHPTIFVKSRRHHQITASYQTAINGIKLEIEGFPHSSQDAEFMVCAETTIWSVMEYFSQKYAEYMPVLPREIHRTLSTISMERQVPSSGLNKLQISYALKELGFGAKMYSTQSYSEQIVHEMIQMYTESGIPVLTGIQNDRGIAHVLNIVGRTEFVKSPSFSLTAIAEFKSGSALYNFYEQPAEYLVIDDNLRPYKTIPLNNPASNYSSPTWANCKIFGVIVPLHKRIYMEANRAKNLAIQSLQSFDDAVRPLPDLILRVLLSSTRSFKHFIALNPDLDATTKTLITNLSMPKFVWIAEVTTEEFLGQGKAVGMLLMDATEPNSTDILGYLLENVYIGPIDGRFNIYPLPLRPFRIYNNLKPF